MNGRLESIRRIHNDVISSLDLDVISEVAIILKNTMIAGNKVMMIGCGGSAADAQHFSAELVGRFHRTRAGLPAIALTTDSSILTALANDFGFAEVFARQVQALGRKGDILIAISTSGSSEVILRAIQCAKLHGIETICFTGLRGTLMASESWKAIVAPSESTARIQEAHGLAIHMICHLIDEALA